MVVPVKIEVEAADRFAALAFTLPYVEFSHAMMRAHLDVRAMAAANRALTDALRDVLRRQMDLAWELAESTLNSATTLRPPEGEQRPSEVFDKAAAAVRELGEAVIEAQIGALRTLQHETAANPRANGHAHAA